MLFCDKNDGYLVVVEVKVSSDRGGFCRCLSWSAVSTVSVTCPDRSAPNWHRCCASPRPRWRSGSRTDATRRSGNWCWSPSNSISSSSIIRWLRRWRAPVAEWPSKCWTPSASCTADPQRRHGTTKSPSPRPLPTYSAHCTRCRRTSPPTVSTVPPPSCPGRFLVPYQWSPDLRRSPIASENAFIRPGPRSGFRLRLAALCVFAKTVNRTQENRPIV